jgi:hypothetical protein
MPMTRDQHYYWGRQHASTPVSLEGHDFDARWERDLPILAKYGYPKAKLDAFRLVLAEHDTKRAEHPVAVAAKLEAVKRSRTLLTTARQWLDRSRSVLESLAMDHDGVEHGAAATTSTKGLDAQVTSTIELLRTHKALIDVEVEPDALIAAGETLVAQLKAAAPAKSSAKSAAVADSEEIDVLDGRLLEYISAVNSSARKAFRALKNKAKVNEYKYHYLRGKPSETADDAPAEEPAPASGPAPS